MFSGRGTGPGALRCPALQQAVGDSDLAVPPSSAVTECARSIGDNRRFYATADTVGDLERLRQALGAKKLTLDSASYCTVLAARYAIAHPDRVNRLILDSAVPHDGLDPLELGAYPRAAAVLTKACADNHCASEPVQDLSRVVHNRHDGPVLLAALAALTAGKPELGPLLPALHTAAAGDYTALDTVLASVHHDSAATAKELGQGLHAGTQCQDMHALWGDAAARRPGAPPPPASP
ncbi:hypothetical protein GCM10023321_50120 [Pseudonocardia eucalypti]|uniref:AB hydrolase-1 domain-containing protein n=1 Tax=Pseudonocardia eucalypti TaxID=648755 RepID=A0ABP9QKJ3_9PSEU|nr:pimeloyl-ACP methyl ester carboxylesterase [Pseudonocardia eucalypti]